MTWVRRYFLPILERNNVDIVLCGHSHVYERSCLLNGYYGKSGDFKEAYKIDGSLGRDNRPYQKTNDIKGAVYVVLGCSGQPDSDHHEDTLKVTHPAMVYQNKSYTHFGSMVIDVKDNLLNARFINPKGEVEDYFAITK